ncbi:glycoside hydrolase family 16 protein [Mycolicibacterium komossense]|uniref:Family 16 glycosylhydrolase n=1 Tax=Mycolicibacterium komossense TaxID=1779 RepID=A0ABT3CE95_9MYCO|nr:family 16 glycosylhydrolase [Mycolicibacterium komossense]MCV7227551.1 family 16 glycosylhydrolase [Mycolicibacterium komossense]
MPEMDRRRAMMMTGLGLLAATIPIAEARADQPRPDVPTGRLPLPAAPAGQTYLFQDDFNGPAGSAPDPSKWEVALARETMEDPTFWELPENVGQYRDDRRNVYQDGKSNLVFHAAKDGNTYYSGKVFGKWRGGIGTTWEARIKLNCLTPGAWPAWYLANNSPVNGGEVDIMEWYGNGKWAAGTAVHAKLNGGEHVSQTIAPDSAWHNWRVQWDDAGMRFWKDYSDGALPYFNVAAQSLPDWQFNEPGYQLFPVLDLAVAGSGGGDPSSGTYPADMLIDWVRVW